jgi:flagellar protein FlgJ
MKITAAPTINLKDNAPAADTVKEAKLRKSCKDFEAIILKQMLTTMRKSIPKSGLFNDNFADDIYQSMADDALAKDLAQNEGMGLGDTLYRQLSGQIKSSR